MRGSADTTGCSIFIAAQLHGVPGRSIATTVDYSRNTHLYKYNKY